MPVGLLACALNVYLSSSVWHQLTDYPHLPLGVDEGSASRRLGGSFRLKHWRQKRKGATSVADKNGAQGNLRGMSDVAALDQIAKRARKSLYYWRANETVATTEALSTKDKQYVAFEPDFGGFNNIRLALESVVIFAHATGRSIVLPPKQGGWAPSAVIDLGLYLY
jgi:hypothetical protein